MPEYGLSQSMMESAASLGQDTLLGDAFQVCGGTAERIARDHVQMLIDIENDVYRPMQEIENEVKGIVADKKHLNNITLDYDAAKTRYHSAVKQAQSTVAPKLDVLKEEMEEASTKVEQARDTFATNLYKFATKEPDHGRLLLHWAEAQKKIPCRSYATNGKTYSRITKIYRNKRSWRCIWCIITRPFTKIK